MLDTLFFQVHHKIRVDMSPEHKLFFRVWVKIPLGEQKVINENLHSLRFLNSVIGMTNDERGEYGGVNPDDLGQYGVTAKSKNNKCKVLILPRSEICEKMAIAEELAHVLYNDPNDPNHEIPDSLTPQVKQLLRLCVKEARARVKAINWLLGPDEPGATKLPPGLLS